MTRESFFPRLNRDVLGMLSGEREFLSDLAERCLLPVDSKQRDLAKQLLHDFYGGRVKDPTIDADGLHVLWQDSLMQNQILYLRSASESYPARRRIQEVV